MINRKARAAVGAIAIALLALFALTPHLAHATRDDITGVEFVTKFTAQAIAPSGSATTTSFGNLGNTENQSIQWRGVGTAPNFKVEVLCSLDGTNFVVPATGGTVSGSTTDQSWHVAPLFFPLCKAIQIKVTEQGGANSLAADVILGAQ